MFNMKKIRKLIEKYNIISFDIFDTLLLRPYMKPTDVFLHIEENEKKEGFYRARIEAEKKARAKINAEDILLDDIYDEIEEEYKYLKDLELKYEFQTIQPNPEMVEIFENAKSLKKKVILVSDMYLPKGFIISLLEKNRIVGFDELFLSSEEKLCKSSGNLYKRVLKKLNCKSSDILHIGDSEQGDYIRAKEIGINAIVYPTLAESFLKKYSNYKYQKLYQKYSDNLDISIILKMVILNQKYNSKDFWTDFGFCIGGPTCFGFTKYVLDTAKENNIDKLLFVSRDGYPLIRIFNIINNTNIKGEYFYSSRFLLKSEDLSDYKTYYEQVVGASNSVVLVDTLAITYSVLRIIKKIDNTDRLKNCFLWHAIKDGQREAYYKMCLMYSEGNNNFVPNNYDYIELFMTSPEAPIHGFENGKPKYQEKPDKHEKFRQKIVPYICDGEIDFSKKIKSIFGDIKVKFSAKHLSKYIDNFAETLNLREFCYLSNVKYATERDHSCYRSLIQLNSLNLGFNIGRKCKKTMTLLKLFPNFFD